MQALVIAVVLLNAYCFGANCVERFVNYRTWELISSGAFKAYHQAQEPMIQIFVAAPMAVGFVLQVGLAFWRPSGIDPAAAWVMVGASALGAFSTVVLQLPIHVAFNRSGYSPERMRKLLRTDWIRKAADVVRMAATIDLLHQVIKTHSA